MIPPRTERLPALFYIKFEIMDALGMECACCGETDSLELDHIKPTELAKNRNMYHEYRRRFKENDFSNLQVLCKPCNTSKGKYGACRIHREYPPEVTPSELWAFVKRVRQAHAD